MIGGYFLLDLSPSTAPRRQAYYSAQLAALEAQLAIQQVRGNGPDRLSSPEYRLMAVLHAQVDFANAQIAAAQAAKAATGDGSAA